MAEPVSFRTIRETQARVRDALALGVDAPREERGPETIEVHWLRITSTTKTAGRYPALRFDRDADADTFTSSGEVCWADEPNDDGLETGVNYAAKFSGARSADGLFIYDVIGAKCQPSGAYVDTPKYMTVDPGGADKIMEWCNVYYDTDDYLCSPDNDGFIFPSGLYLIEGGIRIVVSGGGSFAGKVMVSFQNIDTTGNTAPIGGLIDTVVAVSASTVFAGGAAGIGRIRMAVYQNCGVTCGIETAYFKITRLGCTSFSGDTARVICAGDSGGSGGEGNSTVECCPDDPIPDTLTLTFSATVGIFVGLAPITLTYVGSGAWSGNTAPGTLCTNIVTFKILCAEGNWYILAYQLLGSTLVDVTGGSGTCDPFDLVFNCVQNDDCDGTGGNTGSFTGTVTP